MAQVRDKTWDAHYKQLQTFVAKEDTPIAHMATRIPRRALIWAFGYNGNACTRGKARCRRSRESFLTELGVTWEGVLDEKSDKTWDAHYKQLQTFVAKEKHANCPHGYKDPTTALAWAGG